MISVSERDTRGIMPCETTDSSCFLKISIFDTLYKIYIVYELLNVDKKNFFIFPKKYNFFHLEIGSYLLEMVNPNPNRRGRVEYGFENFKYLGFMSGLGS